MSLYKQFNLDEVDDVSIEQSPRLTDPTDPRMQAAINELQDLIRRHFPATTCQLGFGDDPDGVYVTATVDTDDTDEVMDVYLDRLIDLQIEHGLALHIIPVRTPERIAAYRQRRETARPASALQE